MRKIFLFISILTPRISCFFLLLILAGCASNKTMLERCADVAGETPALIAVPMLLTVCIGAGVADEAAAVGKVVAGIPVGVGTQIFTKVSGDKEPKPFPFHGNWCGPGFPAAGTSPTPTDELDRACRRHDMCYASRSYFNCSCDVELVRDIRESTTMPKDLQTKATLVAEYFDYSFCEGCKQVRSGNKIFYSCHEPEKYGCESGPISRTTAYAACPAL